MGLGTRRPGIEDELRDLGLPVVAPGERLLQVRETVAALRALDGSERHTPVVMAVRGPKARALAAEVADTVTVAAVRGESRADMMRRAADVRAGRDIELALPGPVVGDAVAPFMAPRHGPGAGGIPAVYRAQPVPYQRSAVPAKSWSRSRGARSAKTSS